MKKLFTFIALAAVAMGANAFTDTWKSSTTATSPVSTDNVTVTFNNDNGGEWEFKKDYAVGTENGMSVTIAPTAAGNFTIFFGGSITTGKKLHMQDAEGTGLTATLASDPTVTIEDNANPPADIASGDGVVYALEAGKTYIFSASGTKWRFASYKFTNEKEIVYDTEWNFSTWEDGGGFSNQVKNNLGLFACYQDAETQITNFGAIDGSNKGGYTKRFKFGGGGAPLEGTGTPTQRFVYFNVNGDADIAVQCIAAGSSDERILYISDGTNILAQMVTSTNLEELKATYTGNAGVIYIYGSHGINLYDIKATNVGTTVQLDDTTKPTGIESVKAAAKAEGAIYNLAGQKVNNDFKGIAIQNGKKVILK